MVAEDQITFNAKCSDCFGLTYFDGKSEDLYYDGYVVRDLAIGGGDYISFTVDVETGKIIGWDAERAREKMRELSKEG
jgi:hypothetical protein